MKIKGKRITIRPLEVGDVFYMRNWGYHTNPLLRDYNFPIMTNAGVEKWYKIKTKPILDKYYGILNEDDILIGYMGIKNIKLIRRQSTLGIVFDPNYLSMGYGTETLQYFLKYYFTHMKMKRMYLEVAEFNKRAYKLYENMGFVPVAYYLDEFFDNNLDLNNSYYLEAKTCFVITKEKIYNYIYKMRLDRQDFLDRFQDLK